MRVLRSGGGSEWVEVQGARFLVNRLPAPLWEELVLSVRQMERAATRRALLSLKAEGEIPTDEAVLSRRAEDPEFNRESRRVMATAVAYGVAGHSDLAGPDGAPLPCDTEPKEWEGRAWTGITTKQAMMYADDTPLFIDLYVAVARANSLQPEEKKA